MSARHEWQSATMASSGTKWTYVSFASVTGRYSMSHFSDFTYGALNPVLGYLISCVGCFLGLRCTTRARAYQGAARARWLTLAALSIGTTGIWVMHFIAMLGFAIPGEPIR